MGLIRQLPPLKSAFARSVLGEDSLWSLESHLQAMTIDVLNMANWQRGGRGRRPKPLPRPGVGSGVRIGRRDDRDPEEVRAFLDSFRPPEPDGGE